MNFQGNSQSSLDSTGHIKMSHLLDSIYNSQFNDSIVCIPKKVAQNILKYKDSTEALKTAYKNLSDNYQRLKVKSSIQDSAYSYKDKETKVCRELYQTQAKEIELWGIKSHNQSKEIRKQTTIKWIAIILGSAALGLAAIK